MLLSLEVIFNILTNTKRFLSCNFDRKDVADVIEGINYLEKEKLLFLSLTTDSLPSPSRYFVLQHPIETAIT